LEVRLESPDRPLELGTDGSASGALVLRADAPQALRVIDAFAPPAPGEPGLADEIRSAIVTGRVEFSREEAGVAVASTIDVTQLSVAEMLKDETLKLKFS